MNGWVKLHRCLLDKAVWQLSDAQRVVFITILLMANHEGKQWIWKGTQFNAEPGQFVTSLPKLSKTASVSVQSVRTALENLKKLDFLTYQSTDTGRLITVNNWATYQCEEKKSTGKSTGKQQTGNRQLTPNNNDKNDKNEITINLVSVLSEFKTMRDKIKKPLTDHAEKLLLAKLDKMATTEQGKIDILNQSIMNCWQGIFEVKGDKENVRSFQTRANVGTNRGGKTASGVPEDFWG